ncbi:MAG: Rpp14/Pop5 family protein [Candidatus Lokiarchaeota archaeon]|nr:Rpp14/Pop5 family protein [Candidatus Harpocratesius repetitus]
MKYIRQRYVLFEILSPSEFEKVHISPDQIIRELWNQVQNLYGQKGTFKAGLWMIRWDPEHRIGIIRCDNVSKWELIASMAFISKINRIPVIFHSRKTSGTIKKTLKIWREIFKSIPPPRDK